MPLSIRILKSISTKDHLIAVFNDSFTCNKNVESAFVGIVNTQLMAIQLKFAVMTIIDKDCRFGDSSSDDTVLQIFQEEDLCFLD